MQGADPARRTVIAIIALALAGFAFALFVFYPGIITFDALYVYKDMKAGHYGDWQSPVMLALWRLIDPVAPGIGSVTLLDSALYWLAFALAGLIVARQSPRLALVVPLLGVTPPAFFFVGVVWRDVLFAVFWLLAGLIVLAARSHPRRIAAQTAALALLIAGILLRPNAIAAAPLLVTFILWPASFNWKRAAWFYAPFVLAGFLTVQLVYYGVFNAEKQHPLHAIMVFDLGGISHFTGTNVFPGSWTPEQTALIENGCYKPLAWDIYWTQPPCFFVMEVLEDKNHIFGSPALPQAWKTAVAAHPLAYLQHRLTFMATFLFGSDNLGLWYRDLDDPDLILYRDKPRLMALKTVHDALQPLQKPGLWLLVNVILSFLAWRIRDSREGCFVIGLCGSAILYVMTFLPVGVATDFRYAYWSVLTGLIGGTILIAQRTRPA